MKHLENIYDVIVIGGGHAGCEAALAAVRMGRYVALITQKNSTIGEMSCNPAMGGLGKGHLVREVDAMDGIIGKAADYSGIQFRLLNRSKGPAVQGPRIQCDRVLYKKYIQRTIKACADLEVIEAEVKLFDFKNSKIGAVIVGDGIKIFGKTFILCTGTFLRGKTFIGDVSKKEGRVGDTASNDLSSQLLDLGLPIKRLKTGTPPRLNAQTIDWSQIGLQPGDEKPTMLSFQNRFPPQKQISCGITHTNINTHDIIRQNIQLSAMHSGQIEGVGPRYCPSIEDKVTKFSDKESHQVFLEPESLKTNVIYPNGISTSLPKNIQEAYIQTIKGLERTEIIQYGYAVEYDYIDPRSLDFSLRLKKIDNLFFAGQINGTTGYEEAAAQGLVSGISAAKLSKGEEVKNVFLRSNSYIGVMIDDLITKGVTEPYRMFTSRAEYRLQLRCDNADQRMTPIGIELGCIGDGRKSSFLKKIESVQKIESDLSEIYITPSEASKLTISINQDGQRRTGIDFIAMDKSNYSKLAELNTALKSYDETLVEQVCINAMYSKYMKKQRASIDKIQADTAVRIPYNIDYSLIDGLSTEVKSKLTSERPSTLTDLKKIEGITPASIIIILNILQKRSA